MHDKNAITHTVSADNRYFKHFLGAGWSVGAAMTFAVAWLIAKKGRNPAEAASMAGVGASILFLAFSIAEWPPVVWLNRLSPRIRPALIGFGGVFAFAGMLLVASAIHEPEKVNGPGWLGVVAGCIFGIPGVFGIAAGLGLSEEQAKGGWGRAMLALTLTCFGAILTWIGMGPGERHFSGSVAILSLVFGSRTAEWVGRFFFSAAALLVDAMAITFWFSVFAKTRSDTPQV